MKMKSNRKHKQMINQENHSTDQNETGKKMARNFTLSTCLTRIMLPFYIVILLASRCSADRVLGTFTCAASFPTHNWKEVHAVQRRQTACLRGHLEQCGPMLPELCTPKVVSFHCADPLEQTWGCPSSGCEAARPTGYGWEGAGCQIGNVALGKAAQQSGASRPEAEAFTLVDGNLTTTSHTLVGITYPAWWQVDLGRLYILFNITVFNRYHTAYRTTKFSVLAGRTEATLSLVAHQPTVIPGDGQKTYPCPGELFVAQFIKLVKDDEQVANWDVNILHFKEVIVVGYEYLGP